jgi:superfamily II DNA/RNA helicase
LKHEDLTVEGIKQIYLDCNSEQDKFDVLVRLYGLLTIGSSIIFVKVCTKACPFHYARNTDQSNLRPVTRRPDSNSA